MKKLILLFSLFAAITWIAGCDSTPEKPQTAQTAPNDQETGRFVLQKMLGPAVLWEADARPVRMQSMALKDNNGQGGKAVFWKTLFASPLHQKSQTFTWSGMSGPGASRGIDHSHEDSYNPANRSEQTFDLAYLKVDSDAAFATAQKHGGKELLAKNPAQQVMYILDLDVSTNTLRWHVIYGDNESTAKLAIIVNATNGDFLHKE